MKHNIQTISFLIGSFRELVSSFGQNNKTVAYFRSNVQGLINIGQVNSEDAHLVYRIIGMENTDSVKWDISNNKLKAYIQAVDRILQYGNSDPNVVSALVTDLKSRGEITEDIDKLVRETFGIKNLKHDTKTTSGFGSLSYKSKSNADYSDVGILKQHSNMEIRVRNSQAVCSCDPSYYTVCIKHIFTMDNPIYVTRMFEEIINGSKFVIGMTVANNPDSCSHSSVFKENERATNSFRKLDWKKIYEWYKIQANNM